VDVESELIVVNGTEFTRDVNYTINYSEGRVEFIDTPQNETTILANYSFGSRNDTFFFEVTDGLAQSVRTSDRILNNLSFQTIGLNFSNLTNDNITQISINISNVSSLRGVFLLKNIIIYNSTSLESLRFDLNAGFSGNFSNATPISQTEFTPIGNISANNGTQKLWIFYNLNNPRAGIEFFLDYEVTEVT